MPIIPVGWKIIECPYCGGQQIGCDYCDESGLIYEAELESLERYYRNTGNDADE